MRRLYTGPERRYTGPERRRYHRVKFKKPFVVKMRVHPIDATKAEVEHDIVSLRDLSVGGLLFNYNKEIHKGANLEFTINFPMAKNPLHCKGRLIRVEKSKKLPLYYIAVSFIEINAEEKEIIERALEEFSSL